MLQRGGASDSSTGLGNERSSVTLVGNAARAGVMRLGEQSMEVERSDIHFHKERVSWSSASP